MRPGWQEQASSLGVPFDDFQRTLAGVAAECRALRHGPRDHGERIGERLGPQHRLVHGVGRRAQLEHELERDRFTGADFLVPAVGGPSSFRGRVVLDWFTVAEQRAETVRVRTA